MQDPPPPVGEGEADEGGEVEEVEVGTIEEEDMLEDEGVEGAEPVGDPVLLPPEMKEATAGPGKT